MDYYVQPAIVSYTPSNTLPILNNLAGGVKDDRDRDEEHTASMRVAVLVFLAIVAVLCLFTIIWFCCGFCSPRWKRYKERRNITNKRLAPLPLTLGGRGRGRRYIFRGSGRYEQLDEEGGFAEYWGPDVPMSIMRPSACHHKSRL